MIIAVACFQGNIINISIEFLNHIVVVAVVVVVVVLVIYIFMYNLTYNNILNR